MNELATIADERVDALVEEIEAIVIEKVFESQLAKLDMFWFAGEAIAKFVKDNDVKISEVVIRCARDNRLNGRQMGERNLWWACKIYSDYPDRDFPGGKATNLTTVKKYISAGGKEPEECQHEETETICRCKKCHKAL